MINRLVAGVRKNRLVFFLVLVHIFLGIANLVTTNVILGKAFETQLTSYAALLAYGVMGYLLLIRKNWMRIIFIVLFFLSLPSSILMLLKFNLLFFNNLLQLGADTGVVVLLLRKDVKVLYKTKICKSNKSINDTNLKRIEGDLYTNITSVVNEDSIYVTDMECIDDVSAYKDVVGEILALANSKNVEVDVFGGERCVITLRMGDTNSMFFLSNNSDYIDSSGLVKGVNEFLEKINNRGRIYWFWNCDWGQEGGFLYTEEIEKMNDLIEAKNQIQDYGQISDGVKMNIPAEEPVCYGEVESSFDNISLKEVLTLFLGVALLQVGVIDLILKAGIIPVGAISGLLSGAFWVGGLYLIRRTLRRNYCSC